MRISDRSSDVCSSDLWYHGERGAQRVSGAELLVLALLLAVGGGVLWRFNDVSPVPVPVPVPVPERAAPAAPASIPETAAPPAKSIAVLPFENLSRDPEIGRAHV